MKKKDLEMLKKLLVEEKLHLIEKIKRIHSEEFGRKSFTFSDNFGMDDVDIGDIGTEVYNREFSALLLDRNNNSLKKVDEALNKIEEGTYGICKNCGEEISLVRLKAILHTRYCTRCKREMETILSR